MCEMYPGEIENAARVDGFRKAHDRWAREVENRWHKFHHTGGEIDCDVATAVRQELEGLLETMTRKGESCES